jgi:Ca-activated chloride channel family protein
VGVGTKNGPVEIPIPIRDPETGRVTQRRVRANVDVDEALLQRIANATGGRFFRATDAQGLADTFATIDKLEKSEIKTTKYTRFREVFPMAARPAASCLALAGFATLFLFPVTPR